MEISRNLSVLFTRDIRVNLDVSPLLPSVHINYNALTPHPSNVYRCCPLLNSRSSDKLHSVQHVDFQIVENAESVATNASVSHLHNKVSFVNTAATQN